MAIDFNKWDLAVSLSGHDKGKTYVIVDHDEKSIYVADGKLRKIDNPKRKNPRHLQIARNKEESFLELVRRNAVINDSDLINLIRSIESKHN